MQNTELLNCVTETIEQYQSVFCVRSSKLFSDFLVQGYENLTLSCVPNEKRNSVILAKFYLGTCITFYDDFADNPKYINSRLVIELKKIPFSMETLSTKDMSDEELRWIDFFRNTSKKMISVLEGFTHYKKYKKLVEYDLYQIYQCNLFSILHYYHPEISNAAEFKSIAPYNMGMVLAGMFDVYASPDFPLREIGISREFFIIAQRIGHIANSLNTLSREASERDITNEAFIEAIATKRLSLAMLREESPQVLLNSVTPFVDKLKKEQDDLFEKMKAYKNTITGFSVESYLNGLQFLNHLHQRYADDI